MSIKRSKKLIKWSKMVEFYQKCSNSIDNQNLIIFYHFWMIFDQINWISNKWIKIWVVYINFIVTSKSPPTKSYKNLIKIGFNCKLIWLKISIQFNHLSLMWTLGGIDTVPNNLDFFLFVCLKAVSFFLSPWAGQWVVALS